MGLGSNLGNQQRNIDKAIQLIKAVNGLSYLRKAKYYKTKAWGKTDQNDFLNTVVEINTILKPEDLLKELQEIENKMGRVRKEKWGERNIDIDILLYGELIIQQTNLQIPHPLITERSFVLAPLSELNSKLILPKKGKLSNFVDAKQFKTEIMKIF